MCELKIFTEENTYELFNLLESCQEVEQKKEHHPEGDVFTHSLQVLKIAFRETNDVDLILAAMLHDVGKKIESKRHPQITCEMLKDLVTVKTLFLIEHHMRIWGYLKGEMKKLSKCNFLIKHPWLPELIQLARFDHIGRNPNVKISYDKQKIIDRLNKCAELHFHLPKNLIADISNVSGEIINDQEKDN